MMFSTTRGHGTGAILWAILFANAHATMQVQFSHESNAEEDFAMIARASQDLGCSQENAKVEGLPNVILEAIATRLGRHLPSESRANRAGCWPSGDAIAGPSAEYGVHDLLLPPKTNDTCLLPSYLSSDGTGDDYRMHWSNKQDRNDDAVASAQQIYDALFGRPFRIPARMPEKEKGDAQLNFWFLSFVNWFHDDNFRTLPSSDGALTWSKEVGLRLSQVYGHTSERERALRTFEGGKMKTSSIGDWNFYPPRLADVQRDFADFEMWTPTRGPAHNSSGAGKEAPENLSHYFAIGDPRFNMHPGQIVWASIALWVHNSACDILAEEDPTLRDEDLFVRARVVLFHIVQKTRLQDFVSDSVSHLRDNLRIPYDPPTLREFLAPHFVFGGDGGKPNYMEFNHVYQAWHSLIPDSLLTPVASSETDDLEDKPLVGFMWAPELLHTNFTMSDMARSFTETPIAKYGPHNFPFFMKGVTVAALEHERAQRLPGYNDYRRLFGLNPLRAFEDFHGVDDPQLMAELYGGDIEKVEFFTGIVADVGSNGNGLLDGNSLLGDMQLIVVSLLALQDVASTAVIRNPELWEGDFLTSGAKDFILSFEISDVIALLSSDGKAEGDALLQDRCPFRTPGSFCQRPSTWKQPDEVRCPLGSKGGACTYVGVALTEWFYFGNGGYMRYIVINSVLSMCIVCLLYAVVFWTISKALPFVETGMDVQQHDPILQSRMFALGESSARDRTLDRTWRGSSGEASGESPSQWDASSSEDNEEEDLVQVRAALREERLANTIFLLRIRLAPLLINSMLSLAFFVPFTQHMANLLTNPNWLEEFAEKDFKMVTWATNLVGANFIAEVAIRFGQWRFEGGSSNSGFLTLVIHHVFYFLLVAAAFLSGDVAVYKLDMTIFAAWTWEWSLYLPFLLIRLLDASHQTWFNENKHGSLYRSRLYRWILKYCFPAATIVYYSSRLLSFAIFVLVFVCGFQRGVHLGNTAGWFWFALSAVSLLGSLQLNAGLSLIGLRSRRLLAVRQSQKKGKVEEEQVWEA